MVFLVFSRSYDAQRLDVLRYVFRVHILLTDNTLIHQIRYGDTIHVHLHAFLGSAERRQLVGRV